MAVVDPRDAVIRVAVPARPDVLHLLRSVTATVGARLSLPLDDLEDLRIAVDEAATLLLARSGDAERTLHLDLTSGDRTLRVRVRLEPADPDAPDDDPRTSWPWRVISGITDDASIDRSASGTTISFAKTGAGPDR
jgi:serine/threonine-protein kinase RsbW